ncbi:MAG: hypothetical protein LLF80_02585 [Porphyromonadaceae bacterium]|nr:hypothetical protein [Porphyromonadaceae bacterium]
MKSPTKKQFITALAAIFLWLGYGCGTLSAVTKEEYKISTSGLTVSLSKKGEIKSISINGKKYSKPIFAHTTIAGCRQQGNTLVKKSDNQAIIFEREMVHDSLQKSCILIDKFTPTENSIRWEMIVKGTSEPWGSLIQTKIQYPTDKNTLFWTAWGEPQYDPSILDASLARSLRAFPGGAQIYLLNKKNNKWVDPLVPVPFSDVSYYYGIPHFTYKNHQRGFVPADGNNICIPIATVIEPNAGTGLTFALSPEDEIIDLTMNTSRQGDIVFTRSFNRIQSGRECLFSLDITAHEDDWRPGLGWMRSRYPQYFNPPNPQARILGGTAAYSNHFTEFDADKMKKMCFTVNWQASFDFPYMGLFIPPVGTNEQWDRFGGGKLSVKEMNDYAAYMKKLGFYVINYFSVTEFGAHIKYPAPPRTIKGEKDLWKNSNDYLYTTFPNAILPRPDSTVTKPEYIGATPPEGWYSWKGCAVMDCGDDDYRKFLLKQAQRHVNEIPDSYGVCIDRLDWLRMFNERADDGITWFEGRPVRSLVTSWKALMEDLGPIFHHAGKNILVNNHIKRIDFLKHVDGIFDEFTYGGVALNTTAFLCINKPALGWTDAAATVKREGGDAFFQKYLYMGVFPMCPFPGNDHSIGPDPEVEQFYLDYGPLMKLMQNSQWVLEPHVVSVVNKLAKVNMFKIPDGYSIPVVYGESDKVGVKIGNIKGVNNRTVCTVYYPGKETPARLKILKEKNGWYVDVPLERGCGMLKLSFNEK